MKREVVVTRIPDGWLVNVSVSDARNLAASAGVTVAVAVHSHSIIVNDPEHLMKESDFK